jgi:pimeloyl-ACP methyl ester carboxylesterase
MRNLLKPLGFLLVAVLAVSAEAGNWTVADPQYGDGGTDAFYSWATSIPKGAPRIVRRMPFAPEMSLVEAGVSERMLYTSRGGPDGRKPIIVSGGIYLPKGQPPSRGWPVIAWAHGTVGFPDICAPSFNGWSERDAAYLNAWLKQGYAVVASDYEGLGTDGPHPYMMSRSEATAVLDAVVASRTAYPVSSRVVIVGQSQGAHAAANAALMQSDIAPSLDVKGLVLTGWPGTMAMPPLQMDRFDLWSALYLRYLPTYAAMDPAFRPETMLTPAGKAVYESFRTSCGSAAMAKFMRDKPIANTLFAVDPSPLETRAQPHRAYPPLGFRMPVFLGIGLNDEQTSPRLAFDAGKQACALGANIAIHLYPGFTHGSTVLRSQDESTPWVRAAFAGKVPPGGCQQATFPGG